MIAGDVLLLNFPFSDLSGAKLRPVLVLAIADRDEYVVCQITSRRKTDPRAIELRDDAFSEGGLRKASFVRPGKMFTAHRSLMVRRVGRLKETVKNTVRDAVVQLIRKGS
jgi:PemK-like, MazF-like toxin of type II toxin-antitoxin system